MSCFLDILDMATVNASIVCEEVRKTAGRSPTNRAFIMDVAKSLMRPWCVLRLQIRSHRRGTREFIKQLWSIEDDATMQSHDHRLQKSVRCQV